MKINNNNFLPVSLIFALLFSFATGAFASEQLEGRVVGVHDGDTLTLLLPEKKTIKIRLAQIDAPESKQAFGQVSRQSLAGMTFNKSVVIEKETTDRYGRTVGTVYVDGLDVNKEQVKNGMAWAYRKYLHDDSIIAMEESAKEGKLGLWADPNPVPPWQFRRAK
jgi:micrococcal nuclease